MTTPTEEFIYNFHSLTGTTIGERRKNLFLLLNKIQATSGGEIDFSSLHPTTPLEETFKVEALIHLRRIPELVEVLKSENPVLIAKVLKISSWFLEQAFQSVSGDELVTFIFPYVSFNVKVKIVNKLSVYLSDTKKADEIFDAIRQKYGTYLAFKLLPSCSKDFILQIVRSCRALLSSRQMLAIIKKYPELSKSIFNALSSNMSRSRIGVMYRNVFLHLAKTHNESFLDLYNKYNPSLRLGWRATDKFICRNRKIVIKEANNLYMVLHKKQSVKSLRQDFKDFYLNLFPSSIQQFPNSFSFLCSFLQKFRTDEEKLSLLEATFRKTYGSELLDNPECVTVGLLDLLPLAKRERIDFKPHYISEDRWNCYKSIEHSIPYLKKRISLSSDIKTRGDLIVNLVETCRINKDRKSLAEVCKYVLDQHRNDNVNVRQAFLKALQNNFKLENLEEEHWTYINELIQFFDMNHEIFSSNKFLVAFIHHRLLKGFDIKESLMEYLKSGSGKWNLFKNYPIFEKQCLLLTGELLPQIFDDECTLKYRQIDFLDALIDWNKRHPEDEISLFYYSSAIESLKQILTESKDFQKIIEYVLKLKSEDSDLTSLCLSKVSLYFANRDILNWLMQCKPSIVRNHVGVISNLAFNFSNRFFWRQCRNYTHLEIPQKFGASCLNALTREVRGYQGGLNKRNAIVGLSYLMDANEFLEFASSYYPTELRADALSDEDKKLYKLQKVVAGALKNIIPPSLALESILNFCKGDYLKLIHSSLYSVSGNVNEDKLPPFFGELSNRAVSVRKHTFHLTLRVLDRSLILMVFSKFMETEKNPSIPKFLLRGSFNLFIQDPNDHLWDLIKSNICAVHAADKEVVQILTEIDKIPPQYMVRYILFIWEFLENLPNPDLEIEMQKFRLLRSLTAEVIQMLPKAFCSEIIEKYFFKLDYEKQATCNIHSFTAKFIIYCSSQIEQEDRINAIISTLKYYLCKDNWSSITDNFLRHFCSEFLDRKCLSRETFFTFTVLWNSYIKPFEAFGHYLYFQLCLIYIDSLNEDLSPAQIGEKLAKLVDSLSDTYGTSIASVIGDVLRSFVRHFLPRESVTHEKSRYLLIEGMIKGNVSQACLVTAISLLKRAVEYSESQLKHDDIVQFLKQLDDPLIYIHLHHQLYRI